MKTLDLFFLSSNNLKEEGSYFKIGQGFPIVLLHGFAETHEIWNPIVENLAKKFALIIPVIPACGNNNSFVSNFSMESIADFVNEILEKEQIEKTILFGHSMGGYAAMSFAEKFSTKLMGLSLIHSSAAADSEEKKIVREKAITHIRDIGPESFFKTLLPNLYSKKSTCFVEKERHLKMACQYSAQQTIDCYTAMKARPDRQNLLQTLDIPILFIGGQEDTSVHYKDLEHQAALCKQPFLTIFTNVSHTSMHENPSRLLETIFGFLDDTLQKNES